MPNAPILSRTPSALIPLALLLLLLSSAMYSQSATAAAMTVVREYT